MTLTAPNPGAAAVAPGEDLPRRKPTAFVTVLAGSGIVVSLQQTVMVPLVPQLPGILGITTADASWAITATLLTAAIATPTVGRLADMFGKRRLLLACLLVAILGSVVAGLSTTLPGLITGRALAGLGVGVIPLGISLMRDLLPAERLPGATAQMSASLGVGGAFGLPLSALIIEHISWHAVFWVSALLSLVMVGLVLAVVPESPNRPGGRFDVPGAIGLSVALFALLLALSKGGTWGFGSPLTLGLFGGAIVVLLAWGRWELHTPHPLVDLRTTRRPQVLLTNTTSLVFGFAMLTSSLVFPQLTQLPAITGYGFGETILVAGLLQAPGGLAMLAMSPVSARITRGRGPKTALIAGALTVSAGYAYGVFFHSQLWELVVGVIVVSAGVGIAYGAIPALIMGAVPQSQTASANSVNNLTRAVGTSIASAAAGVVLASMTTPVGGHAYPSHAAFVLILALAAISSLVAAGIAAFLPKRHYTAL